MPTDAWRRSAGWLSLPSLSSIGFDGLAPANEQIIGTWHRQCVGEDLDGLGATTGFVSTTYPAASRAHAMPMAIAYPFLVRKVFWFNGATATTDTVEVGVYTEAGAKIISGSATASGATATQEVDVTDTVLRPGRYWLAYVQNGVTATPMCTTISANVMRLAGIAQMASASPLPSTFTPAAVTGTVMPLYGIASRTLAS